MSERWKRQPLGDALDVASGQVDPTTRPYCDMPHIGGENIESHTGRIINVATAKQLGLTSGKYLFNGEDILYSKIRPNLNKVAAPSFVGICSADIYPLRPKTGRLSREFLAHLLRSEDFLAYTEKHSSRTNIPKVNRESLLGYEAVLPPLPEQRRIAEVLDRAEALRAKRRAALAQLDSLTQSLFLDLFGDPATNPKDWPLRQLGELIVDGPQNGLYKPSTDYGSGTPILRIDAFYDGVVTDISTLKRVRLTKAEATSFQLSENDVVINRVNSLDYLGKCALIPELPEPTVFESNMMRMRFDSKIAHPRFVVQFLQTGFAKSQIQMRAKHAVNQASINQQDVSSFRLSLPSVELQQEFARRVTAVEKLKTAHRASLAELDALFATLQHRAFRGEL
jgi:type I restriction enzyme, S subunit